MIPDDRAWLRAFAVHVFTASGAGLALLALLAAARGKPVEMFWWLGAALFIDGIDGTLARRFKVAETLPRWSGDVLDFAVDFTTYVFVPAYAIAASGLLPDTFAAALGVVIVVTSAIYFADREMKTKDNYFRGFPALWNGFAFYLFLWKPASWLSAVAVIAFAIMTFAPIRFVHPFRVEERRMMTIIIVIVASLLAMLSLYQNLDPALWVKVALTAAGVYFLASGHLSARWSPAR
jgi:phosphatidylcholine synthase